MKPTIIIKTSTDNLAMAEGLLSYMIEKLKDWQEAHTRLLDFHIEIDGKFTDDDNDSKYPNQSEIPTGCSHDNPQSCEVAEITIEGLE